MIATDMIAKVATEVCEDDFMFCVTSDDDELDDTVGRGQYVLCEAR